MKKIVAKSAAKPAAPATPATMDVKVTSTFDQVKLVAKLDAACFFTIRFNRYSESLSFSPCFQKASKAMVKAISTLVMTSGDTLVQRVEAFAADLRKATSADTAVLAVINAPARAALATPPAPATPAKAAATPAKTAKPAKPTPPPVPGRPDDWAEWGPGKKAAWTKKMMKAAATPSSDLEVVSRAIRGDSYGQPV